MIDLMRDPIQDPLQAPFAEPRPAGRALWAGRALSASRSSTEAIRRFLRALLRLPLTWKIAGANVLLIIAVLALVNGPHPAWVTWSDKTIIVAVLGAGALSMLALVRLALRPIHELERLARRIGGGDLNARAQASPLADRDMARLAKTMNALLDRLAAERARLRDVADSVVDARHAERSELAHLLQDSLAQVLAAITLQLGAAARDCQDQALAARILSTRDHAAVATEQLCALSRAVSAVPVRPFRSLARTVYALPMDNRSVW